jgi:ERCC4-type nuclease
MVETYGVDFLFPTKLGLVGVQRKTCDDLVASLRGDRMQREIVQMSSAGLDYAVLLIEGQWGWSHSPRTYTQAEFIGFMLSVQSHGILIMYTEDTSGTAKALTGIERWFNKDGEHDSLLRRPKARVSPELHVLQYFDGISLGRAKAIFHHFGKVPLAWICSKEEMVQVPGMGRKTVENMGHLVPWLEDLVDD